MRLRHRKLSEQSCETVIAAIKTAKKMLENHGSGDSDYAHALSRLADAMARLKVVEISRNRRR